ncbi:MAG: type IV toxin-antitoxin system AbiEi family antitoxin domain-containing protein [Clostridia bacterium]
MNNSEKILKLIKDNRGIITTKELQSMGINSKILTRFIEKGIIERAYRGIYIDVNELEDTYFILQLICKKAIFSNDTALYFHGLSDRTPIKYTVTIPSGYNSRLLKDKRFNFFYIKENLYKLGVCNVITPYGNIVKVYDRERTICDIIKNKDKLDISLVTNAIKEYVNLNDKDLILLHKYAKLLNVDDKVTKYLEVLL